VKWATIVVLVAVWKGRPAAHFSLDSQMEGIQPFDGVGSTSCRPKAEAG
jgi:hypothetical protein